MSESRRPVGFGRRIDDPPSRLADPIVAAVPGAANLDESTAAGLLPARPERGHKGIFGKLLVIAGSLDYAGAALLVCRAAGRAGAGLVTLAVPESLQPLFAAKVVEATTMALPEDDVEEVDPEAALGRILDHDHDAIVLGPGLRPGLATTELISALLAVPDEPTPAPTVVDAEALRALASLDGWWEGVTRKAVLTPHVGEFRRLRAGSGVDPDGDGDLVADDAARAKAAAAAAAQWRQVVVLKGARTVIASPDGPVAIAPFENPALASGGTGDVLSGTIGALLAQGLAPFDAARLGVYLHGLAGEAVRARLGDAGLLASDLTDELPFARKRLSLAAKKKPTKRVGFGAREAATREAATREAAEREVAEREARDREAKEREAREGAAAEHGAAEGGPAGIEAAGAEAATSGGAEAAGEATGAEVAGETAGTEAGTEAGTGGGVGT